MRLRSGGLLGSMLIGGMAVLLAGSPVLAVTGWIGPQQTTSHPIAYEQTWALAVDNHGKAHGVFMPSDRQPPEPGPFVQWIQRMEYFTNATGSWTSRTLLGPFGDDSGVSFSTPAITVDGARHVHIVIAMDDPGGAPGSPGTGTYYFTDVSGSWTRTRLSRSAWIDPHVVVRNGKLHIAYGNGNGIFYRTNKTGRWVTTRVTTGAWSIGGFGLDRVGKGHIAAGNNSYGDPANRLYYLTNASGTWVRTTISQNPSDYNLLLDVDGAGKVHLVWGRDVCQPPPNDFVCVERLLYRTNRSGAWVTNSNIGDGYNESIAVGLDGKVWVASQTSDFSGIQVMSNATGPWVTQVLTGNMEDFAEVDVDVAGHAHLLFRGASAGPDPKNVLLYMRHQ